MINIYCTQFSIQLDILLSSRKNRIKLAVVASAKDAAGQGKLGVAVRSLSAEEKKSASLTDGVFVEDVAGAAAKAGVRAGDVIVSVNRTPVKSPEQLKELIGKAGKSVALLVQAQPRPVDTVSDLALHQLANAGAAGAVAA